MVSTDPKRRPWWLKWSKHDQEEAGRIGREDQVHNLVGMSRSFPKSHEKL
jgi:hypothetical protein